MTFWVCVSQDGTEGGGWCCAYEAVHVVEDFDADEVLLLWVLFLGVVHGDAVLADEV